MPTKKKKKERTERRPILLASLGFQEKFNLSRNGTVAAISESSARK